MSLLVICNVRFLNQKINKCFCVSKCTQVNFVIHFQREPVITNTNYTGLIKTALIHNSCDWWFVHCLGLPCKTKRQYYSTIQPHQEHGTLIPEHDKQSPNIHSQDILMQTRSESVNLFSMLLTMSHDSYGS